MDYRQLIIDSINIDGIDKQDLLTLVTAPKDSAMGDLCIPCFKLAKEMKNLLWSLQTRFAKSVDKERYDREQVTAVAGFVNFRFDNVKFAKQVLCRRIGKMATVTVRRAMREWEDDLHRLFFCQYCRLFHMGHLLNTALGRRNISHIYRAWFTMWWVLITWVIGALNSAN